MTKNNELQFESDEVKVYVQQLQAENSILRQSNDEKNELLIKLGCPTTANARRKVYSLEEQLNRLSKTNEELIKAQKQLKEEIAALNTAYDDLMEVI